VALKARDTSAAFLAGYESRLKESFVLRDLETSKAIPRLMENPRLFAHYPNAISSLLTDLYAVGPEPVQKISRRIRRSLRKHFLNAATVKDIWSMRNI